jgi:uncharacterized phiE125 gp8 family phage protein
MGRTLDVAPTEEPISLDEAKLHLREDEDQQNELIESLIQSAREHAEQITGRVFCTQQWILTLDRFPLESFIKLPFPPLISVEEVNYVDENGVTQILSTDDYVVDLSSQPFGKIDLAYSVYWPVTRCQPNAVSIEFTCGFGDKSKVPASIKAAMKLHLAHLYENREASSNAIVTELPMAYDNLLWPWRVWEAA